MHIVITPHVSEGVDEAIYCALDIAGVMIDYKNKDMILSFNGINLKVTGKSTFTSLERQYEKEFKKK